MEYFYELKGKVWVKRPDYLIRGDGESSGAESHKEFYEVGALLVKMFFPYDGIFPQKTKRVIVFDLKRIPEKFFVNTDTENTYIFLPIEVYEEMKRFTVLNDKNQKVVEIGRGNRTTTISYIEEVRNYLIKNLRGKILNAKCVFLKVAVTTPHLKRVKRDLAIIFSDFPMVFAEFFIIEDKEVSPALLLKIYIREWIIYFLSSLMWKRYYQIARKSGGS